ncbi:MAG: glycosyltransferase family 8 protein [Alphaproteobacteria bacterium]|nr:glycosyltransferase family 8 protein [Alphaproteobacteria bacterium]
MRDINVLWTFDTKFWQMAGVSIYSLMHNKADDVRVNVYCMVAPKTHGRKHIEKIVREGGGKLIWREIRPKENPFRNYDFKRWSPVIFYRLFAHRIFPGVEKMLYLDSDTLVYADVSDLFDLDLTGYALGGVRDMAHTELPDNYCGRYVREFKQRYLKNDMYINSGVLLLNLAEMGNYEQALADVKAKLTFPDQDIINVALDGKIYELPLKYNCVPDVTISNKFSPEIAKGVIDDFRIAHFYALKPYLFDQVSRAVYVNFMDTARRAGFYPEDFIKKNERHYTGNRTHIPFLQLNAKNEVSLFGIPLGQI